MRPADTSPEAWRIFLETQRRMTPADKIALAFEWSEMVRSFAEAGLRQQHPRADDHEILLRYARMTMGEEVFHRVYGADALRNEPTCRDIQGAR